MKTLFTMLSLVLIGSIAKADLFKSTLFSFNTIYLDRDYSDNGSTSQAKITDTDMRLMRIEKHWAYGFIYSLSSNDSSDASRSSYGLSVGYFSEKDFYLQMHYFLASKYAFNGNSEYTKGGGYEFDLGFLSKVTSSFYVGIVFAIKNFTYSELTTSGSKSTVSASHREVMPMFTFAVNLM